MAGPLRAKFKLWRESSLGVKSRFKSDVNSPVSSLDSVDNREVKKSIRRGDKVQQARLKYYPSINVDFAGLHAGHIDGDADDAEELLFEVGFRNGPLAYVEVTDQYGPDDGSYWLTVVRETGQLSMVENRTRAFRRVKDQIHVTIYDQSNQDGLTHFLAHREPSAVLQPARHSTHDSADAARGVRDFRDIWYDTFGEELMGKEQVVHPVTH